MSAPGDRHDGFTWHELVIEWPEGYRYRHTVAGCGSEGVAQGMARQFLKQGAVAVTCATVDLSGLPDGKKLT